MPADVEDAQAMQDWLGSEVATLRAAVTSVQRDVFELLSMQRLGLPLLEHQVDMMLALSTSRVPESWAKRIVTPASVKLWWLSLCSSEFV